MTKTPMSSREELLKFEDVLNVVSVPPLGIAVGTVVVNKSSTGAKKNGNLNSNAFCVNIRSIMQHMISYNEYLK